MEAGFRMLKSSDMHNETIYSKHCNVGQRKRYRKLELEMRNNKTLPDEGAIVPTREMLENLIFINYLHIKRVASLYLSDVGLWFNLHPTGMNLLLFAVCLRKSPVSHISVCAVLTTAGS